MARSTHPAIAAMTEAELVADGCCEGADAAREYSGLPLNTLYDLMNSGALPWRRPAKARLIPRRALQVILADLFAGAEDAPLPRPGTKQPA